MSLAKRITILFSILCFTGLGVEWADAHTQTPNMVTWAPGQTLSSTDLNNAFSHLHNTLSGGIVDANINASAAIQHSKLQTPALVPKAWAYMTNACPGAAATVCTVESSGFTSVTKNANPGSYSFNFQVSRPAASYAVMTTPSGATPINCQLSGWTVSGFIVDCRNAATAAMTDTAFSVVVLDN